MHIEHRSIDTRRRRSTLVESGVPPESYARRHEYHYVPLSMLSVGTIGRDHDGLSDRKLRYRIFVCPVSCFIDRRRPRDFDYC